jgi:hypothetical protein
MLSADGLQSDLTAMETLSGWLLIVLIMALQLTPGDVLLAVQVNRYASLHGCRYGAFGTYRYNWFVAFQGDNTLKIAGPYKHNCCNPTILQVGIVLD